MTEPNNPPDGGIRLSKEDRKNLLAELERATSRSESPEQILQRAQQAVNAGNPAQARRLLDQLQETSPHLPGILAVRAQLEAGEKQKKAQDNVSTTEEMLKRYIQQRKKGLAQFALQTLTDLVPQHPRLDDYRIWVKDLDQEVLLQDRINAMLAAGRTALQAGKIDEAKIQLDALQKVDPQAVAVEDFALQIETVEKGRAAGAGIERAKRLIDNALAKRDAVSAQLAMAGLAKLDVPKITLDFYTKRIGEIRQNDQDLVDAQMIQHEFRQMLAARDWHGAREACQKLGQRLPNDPRTGEMFQRVNQLEDAARREQAKTQGIATLEQFLAAGRKAEAELALKLLRGLNLEPAKMAELEARVRAL